MTIQTSQSERVVDIEVKEGDRKASEIVFRASQTGDDEN
jgi:hypothetical protein